jgi:hypothetical protein
VDEKLRELMRESGIIDCPRVGPPVSLKKDRMAANVKRAAKATRASRMKRRDVKVTLPKLPAGWSASDD